MDKLFRIGEVAKMFHMSVGILRYYEKEGLLKPEYTDKFTGYRYYSAAQFEILNTIRYLRVLDMPLPQIAEFLKNRDVDLMKSMLLRQKETVCEKKRQLQRIERKIDNRLNRLAEACESELETVRIVETKAQRMIKIDDTLKIMSSFDLETPIRKLEAMQTEAVVFLGKIGVGITKEHMEKGEFESYDRAFLLLDDEDDFDGEVSVLPAETCVCIRFCGSHDRSPEHYRKLLGYIAENGMTVCGTSREITLIDYGLTNDPGKFVTEIQIPVARQ